jgi:hypothetical protein
MEIKPGIRISAGADAATEFGTDASVLRQLAIAAK